MAQLVKSARLNRTLIAALARRADLADVNGIMTSLKFPTFGDGKPTARSDGMPAEARIFRHIQILGEKWRFPPIEFDPATKFTVPAVYRRVPRYPDDDASEVVDIVMVKPAINGSNGRFVGGRRPVLVRESVAAGPWLFIRTDEIHYDRVMRFLVDNSVPGVERIGVGSKIMLAVKAARPKLDGRRYRFLTYRGVRFYVADKNLDGHPRRVWPQTFVGVG